MSSAPGLALASTANPALALLGDALAMLPWNHTASPWESGSVLFRRPDGGIWPYDPAGGRKRPLVVDIFVAPPGSGKSVLANTINIGLCLSPAVMGTQRRETAADRQGRYRQIGRGLRQADPGGARPAAQARGDLHLAAVRAGTWSSTSSICRSDASIRCRWKRPSCRTSWRSRRCRPIRSTPFEGMTQLISLVIDEAYRICTETGGGAKHYRRGIEPEVDRAIERLGIKLHEQSPVLARCGELRCAMRASIALPSGRSAMRCRSSRIWSARFAPTRCATCSTA